MPPALAAISIEAHEPLTLARFWAGLLGWSLSARDDVVALVPRDDTGLEIRFRASSAPKVGPNQAHFDLTSAFPEEQQETVARAIILGARHIDVGQTAEEGHIVLADPEGNEFCVIEAGNNFLAECGFLGAVSCDGSKQVGYFWSEALGWPLVWDRDQETAIRSPLGGPKLTWGGTPPQVRGKTRIRLELVADEPEHVRRLLSLGATRLDADLFADPDGNCFRVQLPR